MPMSVITVRKWSQSINHFTGFVERENAECNNEMCFSPDSVVAQVLVDSKCFNPHKYIINPPAPSPKHNQYWLNVP